MNLFGGSTEGMELGGIFVFMMPALIAFLLVLIAFASDGRSRSYKRRIKRIEGGARRPMTAAQAINVRRASHDSAIPFLDQLIKSVLPRPERLRMRLAAAGLQTRIGTYILISLVICAVVTLLGELMGVLPLAANIFFGLFAGIGLPHLALNFLRSRRQKKFIANFPEAIDLMVRGLRSGLPITESIKAAGDEIADPVGSELRQIMESVRFGSKLEDALNEAGQRLDIQEFNFFTVALTIQAETGGNLAETLENLSDVLRRRRQLKLKIKALSSEAKASAYIIGSLPFVMAVLIFLVNSDYIMDLFIDNRGLFLVGLGLSSFGVGAAVMYKMVKFEI